MYVTNDSITTKFEHMTNKELGSYVRAELKKIGITSRMVSVRVRPCGYSTSVDVVIKDLSVDFHLVEKTVNVVEYIRYDEYAQEILSGCNIFVNVSYDWEIMRDAKNAVFDEVKAEMEKINDNQNHKLYEEDGKEVWLCLSKHSDGEHTWYTYHVGKVNECCDRQFNNWDSFVEFMVKREALNRAKEKKIA